MEPLTPPPATPEDELRQLELARQRLNAPLAVAARFPGPNSSDSNDGNDDGNVQEIGQNDSNDRCDSRIDLVDMDDLGDTSASGLYSLPPRAAALAGPVPLVAPPSPTEPSPLRQTRRSFFPRKCY